MNAHTPRPLDLQFILAQILLATIIMREHALLEREGAEISPRATAEFERAARVKAAFASMLTERERASARASFRTVLSDLPGTAELPHAPHARPPHVYPLRAGARLSLVVGDDGDVSVAA